METSTCSRNQKGGKENTGKAKGSLTRGITQIRGKGKKWEAFFSAKAYVE